MIDKTLQMKMSIDNSKECIEPIINYETIVEGLLFIVGDEGLNLEQIAAVTGISEKDAETVVNNLIAKYQQPSFGMEIVSYGKRYKFLSKPIIHSFAKKLFHNQKNAKLSQSALETLAIIAYKQPITRVEIEELRGVGCDMMLRKLVARDLIKEAGRSTAPGRPILYEVTEEFMDTFKLYSLDELPKLNTYQDADEKDLFQ